MPAPKVNVKWRGGLLRFGRACEGPSGAGLCGEVRPGELGGESPVLPGQGWGSPRRCAADPALRCWDPSGTVELHLQDP